jgi:hypothetical protein
MGLIINNVRGYSVSGPHPTRSEFEMTFPAKATLQILLPLPNENWYNHKRALIHLGHIQFIGTSYFRWRSNSAYPVLKRFSGRLQNVGIMLESLICDITACFNNGSFLITLVLKMIVWRNVSRNILAGSLGSTARGYFRKWCSINCIIRHHHHVRHFRYIVLPALCFRRAVKQNLVSETLYYLNPT